jgi:hypothetical protein
MTAMRRLVVILAVCAPLVAASDAGASSVAACGYIHASVPYSAHGQADRWRVYVKGSATCETAIGVLGAVMHLRGHQHLGSSEAGSYFTYSGWLCPFGDMGIQTCELPASLPAHPPIRAHALARDCSITQGGCPAKLPSSDL